MNNKDTLFINTYWFLSVVVIAIYYDLFAVPCTNMTNFRLHILVLVCMYVCLCVFAIVILLIIFSYFL